MKLLGGLLILFASIVAAYAYERSLKQEITRLKEIKEFLEYIRVQIDYFSSSLSKIYQNYGKKTEAILSLIQSKTVSGIPKDISDKISSCFVYLGNGYKKEQLAILDITVKEIDAKLSFTESNFPNKVKVSRAISLFFGLCVLILLM